MSLLFTARHAPVAVEGLCYGRLEVATSVGPDAAARTVQSALGDRRSSVRDIWSSPAARCRETAACLAEALARPLRVDPALYELDYGEWEGHTWHEIQERDATRSRAWMERWETHAPPGGESVPELEARIRGWLARLPAGGLLIAHAGVVRSLDVILRGATWPEAMSRGVEHLAVEVFDLSASRAPRSGSPTPRP